MELLRVENLSVSYGSRKVLDNISFTLDKGEILAVVGESGGGKSTLIHAITGLLGSEGKVTDGRILYKERDLSKISDKEMRKLLGVEIGMIFQDSKASFCPVKKIGSQIYEMAHAHTKLSKKEIEERAFSLMYKINLDDPGRIWNSYPFELSGGMNQRVGICTAMILNPSILLADEPTSALDENSSWQVVDELMMMRRDYDTSIIMVTHNQDVAMRIADRIIILKDGEVKDTKYNIERSFEDDCR